MQPWHGQPCPVTFFWEEHSPSIASSPFKHSSQNCRRKNKMEFDLSCLPGSYLISFHELCLNLSDKNTTSAGIFYCFVFLIILLGDFVPQRERSSAESSVATSSAGRSVFLGTEIKSKRPTRLEGNPSTNQSPEGCSEERRRERPNFGHCSGKFETLWSRAENRSTRQERTGLGAAHCHWSYCWQQHVSKL